MVLAFFTYFRTLNLVMPPSRGIHTPRLRRYFSTPLPFGRERFLILMQMPHVFPYMFKALCNMIMIALLVVLRRKSDPLEFGLFMLVSN